MIQIEYKKKCSGCTACYAVCPKQCIEMKADAEGFKYPAVDTKRCIQCGACERVCSIQNPLKEIPVYQKGFLVQHRDESYPNGQLNGWGRLLPMCYQGAAQCLVQRMMSSFK